jgi:Homeodomain-like domain
VRRPSDSKRLAIIDLASRGYPPAQIAGEVKVSRQYVHTVLDRLRAALVRDHPERLRDLHSSYRQALAGRGGRGPHRRLTLARDTT